MLNLKQRQTYLKYLGFYKDKIDGIVGPNTKKAYRDLQNKYFTRKQDRDGIYGKNTDILLVNAYRVKYYTKNFKLEEFRCECKGYCTGYNDYLSITFLKNLQKVRDKFGPVTVTSGERCTKYNSSIGGIRGSKHTVGKASDIYIRAYSSFSGKKKVVDYWISLSGSSYSYCNGYGRTKWRKTTPVAPNMGNAVHCDV